MIFDGFLVEKIRRRIRTFVSIVTRYSRVVAVENYRETTEYETGYNYKVRGPCKNDVRGAIARTTTAGNDGSATRRDVRPGRLSRQLNRKGRCRRLALKSPAIV